MINHFSIPTYDNIIQKHVQIICLVLIQCCGYYKNVVSYTKNLIQVLLYHETMLKLIDEKKFWRKGAKPQFSLLHKNAPGSPPPPPRLTSNGSALKMQNNQSSTFYTRIPIFAKKNRKNIWRRHFVKITTIVTTEQKNFSEHFQLGFNHSKQNDERFVQCIM